MTDARAPLASLTDSRLNPPTAQHTPNDAMLFTSLHTPLLISSCHTCTHTHTQAVTHADAHFFGLSSTFSAKRIRKGVGGVIVSPYTVDKSLRQRDESKGGHWRKRMGIGMKNGGNADTAGGAREREISKRW